MDPSKKTFNKTTKSVFSIYHKLLRRPCKAAKYSAFQVSHRPKSQDLTKFQSGTSHVTHHTIHSHITYEFEVLQNIKDNNYALLHYLSRELKYLDDVELVFPSDEFQTFWIFNIFTCTYLIP